MKTLTVLFCLYGVYYCGHYVYRLIDLVLWESGAREYWWWVAAGFALMLFIRAILKAGDYYPERTSKNTFYFLCLFVFACVGLPLVVAFAFERPFVREYHDLFRWALFGTPIVLFLFLAFFRVRKGARVIVLSSSKTPTQG
jgi:hypothetical protein